MLVGRRAECERIDAMLAAARSGSAGVLVVVGDLGIGKTALLRYAEGQAGDMVVLRARGSQSEAELSFSGLADLLRPLLDGVPALPPPQAAALAGALRLSEPSDRDRFATYLAAFNLLVMAAETHPLLAILDDVQWLDTETIDALAFVCRRLTAEGIVVLISTRDTDGSVPPALLDLPWSRLEGLDALAAEALVEDHGGVALAPQVRRRLAIASHGNPLALLEIPTVLSSGQRSGRDPLPDPLPVGPSIQRAFGQRLDELATDTRTALLVAAASDSGDLAEISRALRPLSIDSHTFEHAEAAGLVRITDQRIEFVHPLARSTVYAGSDGHARRAAHRLMADAFADGRDADRRAWHIATATVGPDEQAAQDLEQAAALARRRGGPVGSAHAFERAAALSPEQHDRLRRLREAAADWVLAGEPIRATALLDEAEVLGPDDEERARIVRLQASLASYSGRTERAFGLLTAEAERTAFRDPGRAALLLARAALPVLVDGDVTRATETARQAQVLAMNAGGVVAAQVEALVTYTFVLAGEGRDVAPLLAAFADVLPKPEALLQMRLASTALAAGLIWTGQHGKARQVLDRIVEAARDNSAPAMLPYPLILTCDLCVRTGEWAAASAAGHEAMTLARQLRQPGDLLPSLVSLAALEAAQGQEEECRAHTREALEIAGPAGFGSMVAVAHRSLGLLALGLGRPADAIASLEVTAGLAESGGLEEPAVLAWAPDLIEAYMRCERVDDAHRLLSRFDEQAERSGQPSGRAAVARCRGLVDDTREYEGWFAEAVGLHQEAGMPFEVARTEFCLGERMRRDRRRVAARTPLRSSFQAFEQLGARSWADRAAAELRATGEETAVRAEMAEHTLTPQEMQVSLTIGSGATSRQAAAALFLSPRTVDHHLGNVYRKLGVRSRTQLVRLVAGRQGPFSSVQADRPQQDA
jgi:DNA-binding CsgD family transcriptional regulator/tetratricopeptide (TPR) repeat protein